MENPPPTESEKLQDHGLPAQPPQGGQHSPTGGFLMQSTAKQNGANETRQSTIGK